MLTIKQQRLLTFSPLPIAKQKGQDINTSRLEQQISFYNSYVQTQKIQQKKKRVPFQCRYPLRVDATQINISPKKETNTKILINRKNLFTKIYSSQNSERSIRKGQQQNFIQPKNSISRWDEQFDKNESFYLYDL